MGSRVSLLEGLGQYDGEEEKVETLVEYRPRAAIQDPSKKA